MTFVLMGIFGYYYFKGGWWWIQNINWQFLAFFSKFLHLGMHMYAFKLKIFCPLPPAGEGGRWDLGGQMSVERIKIGPEIYKFHL